MKKKIILILCICVIFILSAGIIYIKNQEPIKNNDSKSKKEPGNVKELSDDTVPQKESSSSIHVEKIKHCVINDNPDIQYSDAESKFYRDTTEAILEYKQCIDFSSDMTENRLLLENNPYIKILADYEIADKEAIIKFKYNYSEEEHKQIVKYLDQEFLNIINTNITKNMTELEKILAIYHYFCTRISFDNEWGEQHYNVFSNEELNIYDGLKNNKGVCHTYSYLVQFALCQLDIPTCVIHGKIAKNNDYHTWLSVCLNGLYYYIDPTWDATSDADNTTVSLKYFGLTKDENIERAVYYNELYFSEDNPIVSNNKVRFEDFRDIIDYKLIGNHQMEIKRDNLEKTEIVDLSDR